MNQQAVFQQGRKLNTKAFIATQVVMDMPGLERRIAYLRKTAAFKEWLEKLNHGDRLPRGKFFIGKKPGKPLMIMDEFAAYI